MKVYGALENAMLELLTAAPAVTPTGRLYMNTTTNCPQMYLGAAWVNLAVMGLPTTPLTAGITVTPSGDTYTCNALAGAITMTLVAASSCANKVYRFKKTDVSRNLVTIQAAGSDTIDGQATQTLSNPYDTLTIVSDGTVWWVI